MVLFVKSAFRISQAGDPVSIKGKELWSHFDQLFDNHDHADSYKFSNLDGDGKTDIVTANSETGVYTYEAMTGKLMWQQVSEHSQQLQVGNFLKNFSGPQVVVGGRTYGNRKINEPYLFSQLFWFGAKQAHYTNKDEKKDLLYLKNSLVNHIHN